MPTLKTAYYSVNGRIIGQRDAGGQTDYLTDALGSVTATCNQSAVVLNTYRYKPYGAQLAKTGTSSDPRFTWVGSWGYRQTTRPIADVYVRARHYGSAIGLWTSNDTATRRATNRLSYADSNPTCVTDQSGLSPSHPTSRLSHDHWATVAYNAPNFYNCFAQHMAGKPWSVQAALEACKYCKANHVTDEYEGVPNQCADFVTSSPKMPRSNEKYTPQATKGGVSNKPWWQCAGVENRSHCIVRACWTEPTGQVHCIDLFPGDISYQYCDIDVVCYCGKAYKISDLNKIIVHDDLMEPEPSHLQSTGQMLDCPPIYVPGTEPDKPYMIPYDAPCKDALAYVTGDCCKKPKVKYKL